MKKKTLILFIIIISFISVNAQSNSIDSVKIAKKKAKQIKKAERKARNRYILINFGYNISKMKDQTVSPLLYKGSGVNYGISYLRLDKKKINFYDFNINNSSLDISNDEVTQGSSSTLFKSYLNIYSLYGITNIRNKIFLYFGWHLKNSFTSYLNTKYMNSAFILSGFSESGGTVRVDVPFSWKSKKSKFLFFKINRKERQLRFSFMFGVPLFSHTFRPEYAGINNLVDGKSTLPITHQASMIGKYMYLDSKIELLYELGNYNLIKLSYNWDFLHYDPGYNKIQAANHYFNVSLVIKLNRHQKSINYVKEVNND